MSQFDHRAVLASAALYGYHSKANYVWLRDVTQVIGEDTPLFFCSSWDVYPAMFQPVDRWQ